MSLKDLLVILDQSRHCEARLRSAAALAQRSGAHLTGLYVMPPVEISPFQADQFAPEELDSRHALVAQHRDDAKALFKQRTTSTGLSAEWREARRDATEIAIWYARHTDLTVLGQPDPDEATGKTSTLASDRLVLASGRPTLMIPYRGDFENFGSCALVAWDASHQAVHAVNDALPLLAQAETVVVLTIDPDTAFAGVAEYGDCSIETHLKRHGIPAHWRPVQADRAASPGETILSVAADAGADLIVMGVYGHSRLREMALGGVSRHVLSHTTVPLLLSH
jgi:nucleotide-binding universal stress UspA family protein